VSLFYQEIMELSRSKPVLRLEEEAREERREPTRITEHRVLSPEETVRRLRSSLDRFVYGQECLKTLLLAAVASGVDALVVSPPGEAKTYTVDVLAHSINGCRYFKMFMSFEVTVYDIAGPPIVHEYDEAGKKRIEMEIDFSRGIVNAHIALFDEVFKAPGQVAQLIYGILAERKISYRGQSMPLKKLWVTVGLSNEKEIERRADDELFEPLFDRFYARLWLPRTPPDQILAILDLVYQRPDDPRLRSPTPVVSVDDVERLRQEVNNMIRDRSKYSRYRIFLAKIIEAAKDAGIEVSPRKAVMLLRLIPALELVGVKGFGAKIYYLRHSLAGSKDEAAKLGEVIAKKFGLEVYQKVEELIAEAEREISRANFGLARDKLARAERMIRSSSMPDDDKETYLETIARLKKVVEATLRGV